MSLWGGRLCVWLRSDARYACVYTHFSGSCGAGVVLRAKELRPIVVEQT
jgi:hypothetical protein